MLVHTYKEFRLLLIQLGPITFLLPILNPLLLKKKAIKLQILYFAFYKIALMKKKMLS